jgi:hypothetical protein
MAALLGVVFTAELHAQGTAFTYQGRLQSDGAPYFGPAEFQFTLWDAAEDGTQLSATTPETLAGTVSNGLFTLTVDFGSAPFTNGSDRWLQIELRTGLGAFEVLSPRQKLTPTPYAITAGYVTGPLPSAGLVGTYGEPVTFNNAANSFSGNGAGLTALNASQLTSGTVPDERLGANVARTDQVWLLGGNGSPAPGTYVLGAIDFRSFELRVNNVRALRIEPNINNESESNIVNMVAGSPVNAAGPGVRGATISGGGAERLITILQPNRVTGDFGTVSGGHGNTSGIGGAVGGGRLNTSTNVFSTIAGGSMNLSAGSYAAVGGGLNNTSSGDYATVPGGIGNTASGDYSLAAGRNASAGFQGSFVWADSQAGTFPALAQNQVNFRCAGGVRFTSGSGAANQTLFWVPGSASWTFTSDRAKKEGFKPVDSEGVLEKVAALPVTEWNYKGYPQRHIGCTAQDFHAAFPLNDDNTTLNDADLHGVALAAIQGLNQKVERQRVELQQRESEIAEMKQQLHELEQLLNANRQPDQR